MGDGDGGEGDGGIGAGIGGLGGLGGPGAGDTGGENATDAGVAAADAAQDAAQDAEDSSIGQSALSAQADAQAAINGLGYGYGIGTLGQAVGTDAGSFGFGFGNIGGFGFGPSIGVNGFGIGTDTGIASIGQPGTGFATPGFGNIGGFTGPNEGFGIPGANLGFNEVGTLSQATLNSLSEESAINAVLTAANPGLSFSTPPSISAIPAPPTSLDAELGLDISEEEQQYTDPLEALNLQPKSQETKEAKTTEAKAKGPTQAEITQATPPNIVGIVSPVAKGPPGVQVAETATPPSTTVTDPDAKTAPPTVVSIENPPPPQQEQEQQQEETKETPPFTVVIATPPNPVQQAPLPDVATVPGKSGTGGVTGTGNISGSSGLAGTGAASLGAATIGGVSSLGPGIGSPYGGVSSVPGEGQPGGVAVGSTGGGFGTSGGIGGGTGAGQSAIAGPNVVGISPAVAVQLEAQQRGLTLAPPTGYPQAQIPTIPVTMDPNIVTPPGPSQIGYPNIGPPAFAKSDKGVPPTIPVTMDPNMVAPPPPVNPKGVVTTVPITPTVPPGPPPAVVVDPNSLPGLGPGSLASPYGTPPNAMEEAPSALPGKGFQSSTPTMSPPSGVVGPNLPAFGPPTALPAPPPPPVVAPPPVVTQPIVNPPLPIARPAPPPPVVVVPKDTPLTKETLKDIQKQIEAHPIPAPKAAPPSRGKAAAVTGKGTLGTGITGFVPGSNLSPYGRGGQVPAQNQMSAPPPGVASTAAQAMQALYGIPITR